MEREKASIQKKSSFNITIKIYNVAKQIRNFASRLSRRTKRFLGSAELRTTYSRGQQLMDA